MDSYRDLFQKSCEFSFGVFTTTMLDSVTERANLRKYISRNPGFFERVGSNARDTYLYILTKEARKKLSLPERTTSAQTWHGLFDIALFFAYMCERKEWAKISNNGHEVIKIGHENVGLLSGRWGLCRKPVDKILSCANLKDEALKNEKSLEQLLRQSGLPMDMGRGLIEKAYTPKALEVVLNLGNQQISIQNHLSI